MKHLTQRVAWHDQAWNGTVCARPSENAFCSTLDRIREERDDAYEDSLALTPFDELRADAKPGSPNALPPCRAESGAFMSPREWSRSIEHPYQRGNATQATHGHLRPTLITSPPFSSFAIPFAWMLRQEQERIAESSPLQLPNDEEPPFNSPWIFGRRRQAAVLERFFGELESERSLMFFYTKEGQPISESISRLALSTEA